MTMSLTFEPLCLYSLLDCSTRSFNIQIHINSLKRGKLSILFSSPLFRHIEPIGNESPLPLQASRSRCPAVDVIILSSAAYKILIQTLAPYFKPTSRTSNSTIHINPLCQNVFQQHRGAGRQASRSLQGHKPHKPRSQGEGPGLGQLHGVMQVRDDDDTNREYWSPNIQMHGIGCQGRSALPSLPLYLLAERVRS